MTDNVNSTEEINEESLPEREIVFEEALEAILFAAGHPVNYVSIAKVVKMTPHQVKNRVFEYALSYNKSGDLPRGVMLLTFSDSCQLCTKEYYLPEIREALGIRKSGSLSTAAMETLAVVAYNQPVTRLFVDTVRKVDSSYAMNSLIDRGLIECVGRLDVPGRPMQYGVTADFFRCFGMKGIEDLPLISDELISMFEKGKELEDAERAGEDSQISFDEIVDNALAPDNHSDDASTTTDKAPSDDNESIDDDSAETSAEDDIVDID